jgi:hypothetical protein
MYTACPCKYADVSGVLSPPRRNGQRHPCANYCAELEPVLDLDAVTSTYLADTDELVEL